MPSKSEQHFLEAIDRCYLKKIIQFIQQGVNIHAENSLGQNYLIYLLQQQQQQDPFLSKKRLQIFQVFITNYNLPIHSFDFYGKNVFNWATNLNCTQEALYLLHTFPGDIDILVRDQSGSCSLHYAVEHGNEILVHAIVNYLLRYRLRFDIKDTYNNTPEDLARKLGYDRIAFFLAQACRSTVFMSREIPNLQRPMTPKLKQTTTANSSTMLYSPSVLDSSEYFNLIETRVNEAKNIEDWKTVAALRAYKRQLHKKHANRFSDPIPQVIPKRTSTQSLVNLSIARRTSKSMCQSEQMLRLVESQICPSFRRSFIPSYQRSIHPINNFQRSPNVARKMSQASSRRMSSVLSIRKRDSDLSQLSIPSFQDSSTRFSMPAVYKHYRQTGVSTN